MERRIGMMDCKQVILFLAVSCSFLSVVGCTGSATEKAELEGKVAQLTASLQQTEQERDTLQTQVLRLQELLKKAESNFIDVTQARERLQRELDNLDASRVSLRNQVDELTKSRDNLQNKVNDLVDSQSDLQRKIEELTRARDAAIIDARDAQAKIDKLTVQLQSQVTQINDLQSQIKAIKAIIGQLEQRLK
jgi:chromosome segregation ATPase